MERFWVPLLAVFARVVYETYSGNSGFNYEQNHTFVYGLERISQTCHFVANNQSQTQRSYYAYDGHGSVRALTSSTGAITDTYDYDAFGNLLHSTGATFNEFLFAGEQFDLDLNLYYNRARYLICPLASRTGSYDTSIVSRA